MPTPPPNSAPPADPASNLMRRFLLDLTLSDSAVTQTQLDSLSGREADIADAIVLLSGCSEADADNVLSRLYVGQPASVASPPVTPPQAVVDRVQGWFNYYYDAIANTPLLFTPITIF